LRHSMWRASRRSKWRGKGRLALGWPKFSNGRHARARSAHLPVESGPFLDSRRAPNRLVACRDPNLRHAKMERVPEVLQLPIEI
jgi:hypothetical protein